MFCSKVTDIADVYFFFFLQKNRNLYFSTCTTIKLTNYSKLYSLVLPPAQLGANEPMSQAVPESYLSWTFWVAAQAAPERLKPFSFPKIEIKYILYFSPCHHLLKLAWRAVTCFFVPPQPLHVPRWAANDSKPPLAALFSFSSLN